MNTANSVNEDELHLKRIFALLLATVMLIGASAPAKVSIEPARQIVLAKDGLKESEIRLTKAHQDTEDGRKVYEIEFAVSGMECEFDIVRYP
jgi:uncharacterized membrane protein YkoI